MKWRVSSWILLLVLGLIAGLYPVAATGHVPSHSGVCSIQRPAPVADPFLYDAEADAPVTIVQSSSRRVLGITAGFLDESHALKGLRTGTPSGPQPIASWLKSADSPARIAGATTTIRSGTYPDLLTCTYIAITLSHWIEIRVWLSPDPAGFVDGPNLYAYVRNNPWSSFDPHGLANRKIGDVHISDDKLHQIPFVVMRDSKLHEEVAYWINALRLKSSHPHGGAGHFFYNQILKEQVPRIAKQMASEGLDPRNTANLSRQSAKAIAEELIRRAVTDSADEYVQWFNKATQTLSQEQIAAKSAIKEFEYRKARGMEIKGRLVTRLCDAALMGEELSDEINRVLTKRSRKFKIAMKGTAFATAGLTSLLFFYDPGEAVANLTGAETLGDATVSGGLTRSLEVADDPLLRYVLLTNKLWNEGLYGEEADELDFLTEELETEILTHQIVVGSSYIGAGFVWPLTINPYEGRENKQK